MRHQKLCMIGFKRGSQMCLPVDLEQLILSMAKFLQYVIWHNVENSNFAKIRKKYNSLWFPKI